MRDEAVSNLKSDERIVFVTTDARLSTDQSEWIIPVHVWVHEYEKATIRKASIAAALRVSYGLSTVPATRDNFDHRARLIAADNERGKEIVIRIAGHMRKLPATQPNGHAEGEFRLSTEVVNQHAHAGAIQFSAVLPDGDNRSFAGHSRLVPSQGVSIISDFDDTVKITHATDRGRMLDHTMFRDFESVPGMAQLYSSWAESDAALHFVSSSPWHLYEPIDEFLQESGFPEHSMCLRHFRFKDSSLLNLFRPGTETKPGQIYPILKAFPGRRFILAGDSGQHDPEVYAETAKAFPKQITRILIRNVTNAHRDDRRFREVFAELEDERWILFSDPAELPPLAVLSQPVITE